MKAHDKLLQQRIYIDKRHVKNSGIYFLIDDNDDVVYVGQSMHGISRIYDHLKGKPDTMKQFSSYVWISYPGLSSEELSKYENTAINKYQPKYNISYPCGVITDGKADYYTITAYAKKHKLKHYVVRDRLKQCMTGDVPLIRNIKKYFHEHDMNSHVKSYCLSNKGHINDYNEQDQERFKANHRKFNKPFTKSLSFDENIENLRKRMYNQSKNNL